MGNRNIYAALDASTYCFRKGAEVVERDHGNVHVTEVYGYPSTPQAVPEGARLIDCHFIDVGVNLERAREVEPVVKAWLADYPEPERLAGGPSYIELGAEIGSQELAFRLFAYGEAMGYWRVITPEKLGVKGEFADALAGQGMIMITGYHPGFNADESKWV